ncbi:OLC1v1009422C1 [Oldenlandia corymbosa var. corymbosa]|uniref:OLC1v1009422C1 n=1 Tax=Oldenlandia corymbosa var. corymbosa TaxID=529605 RepID=A0AAV1DS41_OLDCO|nr:OLC1v1009422C1 [Oldenlandia corymbosa var. corymbosa]
MREVRDTYLDRKEKYDAFIALMREYKDKRVDNLGVIAGLKELFVGHLNLLLGFNKFLPREFEITLDDEVEVAPDETIKDFEEGVGFIEKVKKRFGSNHLVYTSFLDHLHVFKYGGQSVDEVYREVAPVFKDHPDLLVEFTKYIPEN